MTSTTSEACTNSRWMQNALTGTIIASSLLSVEYLPISAAPWAPVAAVHASARPAQKSTFFRFSPKFIEGRNYYRTELKNAIDHEDWQVVGKFFEVYVSRYNKNFPDQVDAYDTYVNKQLYRPMKVIATSFSDRSVSPKETKLTEHITAFEKAMAKLEGSIKDRKGEGLFAGTIKAPTGKERTKQAKEAWAEGKAALDQYTATLNDGLMLELNKIPL